MIKKIISLFRWRARKRRRQERERMIQYLCQMIIDAEKQLGNGEQKVKVKDIAYYAKKILDKGHTVYKNESKYPHS